MARIEELHDAFIIPPNIVSKVASIDEASAEGYRDNREVGNNMLNTPKVQNLTMDS